jgi:protein ImuB
VPPALRVERRFAEPIARTEDALAAIEDLAREAATAMDERGQGGRRFAARLFRSDGQIRDLAVETSQPTRDPALLLRLFDERIDSLADPIDPGFGFDLIALAVPVLEPLVSTQLALDGGEVSDGELIALIDRLSTRLGRGRFRRLAPRDTHIPEQAVFTLPTVEDVTPAPWPSPKAGEPPLRPIHLFDPPQPIEVPAAAFPDGPPRRFIWRRNAHEVTRYEGPERIAAQWWRHDDHAGLTRDYFRIEDSRGRRFWVFRHGLYREKPDPRWYLHGLFA